MRRIPIAFVVAALVAAVGCGSTSPSPPVDIAGTWKGTVADGQLGTGAVTATINQSNAGVAGTWSAIYPNPSSNNNGTLTGTVDGSNVSITIKSVVPGSCAILFSGRVSGTNMSGPYATVNCTETVTGTLNVTKQ